MSDYPHPDTLMQGPVALCGENLVIVAEASQIMSILDMYLSD